MSKTPLAFIERIKEISLLNNIQYDSYKLNKLQEILEIKEKENTIRNDLVNSAHRLFKDGEISASFVVRLCKNTNAYLELGIKPIEILKFRNEDNLINRLKSGEKIEIGGLRK